MRRMIIVSLAVVLALTNFRLSVGAQSTNQNVAPGTSQKKNKFGTCAGPIYKGNEVTKKARTKRMIDPDIPAEALTKVTGLVQIRAVLCVTGKVTDIEVIRGLPYGVTESVIRALLKTKFEPAEKDGQPVSQYLVREVRLDGTNDWF